MKEVKVITTIDTNKNGEDSKSGTGKIEHQWKNKEKITCIKTDPYHHFTINKIYKAKIDTRWYSETIINDNNIPIPISCCYENFTTIIKYIRIDKYYKIKQERKQKLLSLKTKYN